MKKILTIILSVLFLFVFTSCKDNKDGGHLCESKCEVCQLCTDADCTDAVCSDKCLGHTPHTHNYGDATCQAPATCSCGDTQGETLDCAVLETREGLIAGTCQWCGEDLNVEGYFYENEEEYEQNGNTSAAVYQYGGGDWVVLHDANSFSRYTEKWDNAVYSATNYVPSYGEIISSGWYLKIDTHNENRIVRVLFYEYDNELRAWDGSGSNLPDEYRPNVIDARELMDSTNETYADYRAQLQDGLTFDLFDDYELGVRFVGKLTIKLVTARNSSESIDAVIDFTFEFSQITEFKKVESNPADSITYDSVGDYYKVVSNDLVLDEAYRRNITATYNQMLGVLTVTTSEYMGEPVEETTDYFRLYSDNTMDRADTAENLPRDESKQLFTGSPWGEFFCFNGDDTSKEEGVFGCVFYEDSALEATMTTFGYYFVCTGESGDVSDVVQIYDYSYIPEEYKRELLKFQDASTEDGFELELWYEDGNNYGSVGLTATITFETEGITVTITGGGEDYSSTLLYENVSGGFSCNSLLTKVGISFGTLDNSGENLYIWYDIDEEGNFIPDYLEYQIPYSNG